MDTRENCRVRFIILNAPRTGSNYLCTLLNSHPEVLCHHEIFNPHVVGVARHLQKSGFFLGTIAEREQAPVEFLERVWQTNLDRPCVGFKMCWRQNETIFHTVLTDSNVQKIILKRRNRVKSFVSLLLARQTGEWVIYQDDQPPAIRPKVHVDPATMFETMAFNSEFYGQIESALQSSGQNYLTLFYEDLFSEASLRSALVFLGVSNPDPSLLQGECWKLAPSALSDVVSNFEELGCALRGTEFEADLHSLEL